MKFSIILSSVAAFAAAAVDPLTVTSLNAAQSAAFFSAEQQLIQSLTNGPDFTSILLEVATETAALAAFTSAAAALTAGVPTGSAVIDAAKSLISVLPSGVASYYNSILSAELSIASSVVNDKGLATGGSAQGVATTGAATSTSSGSGAVPTAGVVKAAGVAVGIFAGAVAML
ncbi:uncharacterized protein PV09_03098 [Verruconis gallopava]|uniref:FAS1 domain-containing protein n=1 Tax=Verruconis gallopava TaxID=253628 RepID=A0A0D2B3T0_9PEZI|nr:uncharacterized protein PV09_03098 [Verruconis gallopava]KIW05904.1 hypothetical protein PV09_03098 [Verruconis gallopava]